MSSPASHYRKRNILSNQYIQKRIILKLKTSEISKKFYMSSDLYGMGTVLLLDSYAAANNKQFSINHDGKISLVVILVSFSMVLKITTIV